MKIKDIKTAPWNPRKMGKDAKEALKKSLDQFGDISGIVVNKPTGEVLAGNHRWEQLLSKHGKSNVELKHVTGETYSLDNKKEGPTGVLVRVVDWDEATAKAANITANSDLISGEYTSELQNILSEIQDLDFDDSLFEDLRLDELQIDLDGVDEDLEWTEEDIEKVQKSAEEKNNNLDDTDEQEAGPVKDIRSEIKISVPSDLKDDVKDDVLEFLAKQTYYGEITIV